VIHPKIAELIEASQVRTSKQIDEVSR
jgi:hypothetical protein